MSRCRPEFGPGDAPGRDAVSLLEVDGRLSFVVDPSPVGAVSPSVPPQVKIAPVDLDAIAVRPDTPAGCRSARERYEGLLASRPRCEADADCTALRYALGTSDLPACTVYLISSKCDPKETPVRVFGPKPAVTNHR